MKPQPISLNRTLYCSEFKCRGVHHRSLYHFAEVSYVKGKWAIHPRFKTTLFSTDGNEFPDAAGYGLWKPTWKSPLHLPEKLARYFIQITEVRAERVQDITEADAVLEGCRLYYDDPNRTDRRNPSYVEAFHTVWDATNGPGAWERNDWVWVYTYKRRLT